MPSRDAAKKHGCSQVLWLYGDDHQVTEVGAMNIFFALKKKNGAGIELVTPPLTRGDILPGVTRGSIVEMVRSWPSSDGVEVSERFITMKEVLEAQKDGRVSCCVCSVLNFSWHVLMIFLLLLQLLEIFGAGTAAVISPVGCILYQDKEVVPAVCQETGPLAMRLYRSLLDIQYGNVEHPWSVVVK